jgi:hypothetical protein
MTSLTSASRFIRTGIAAVAMVALIPISSAAPSSGRSALKRVPDKTVTAKPFGQRPITVVLKMSGDPVAVLRSRAPNKQLAEGERQLVERSLRGKQDAIVPSIRRMGGTVLGQLVVSMDNTARGGSQALLVPLDD